MAVENFKKASSDVATLLNVNSNIAFQLDEFYLDLQEDGNRIKLLEPEEVERKPFPGLRPYKTSEFQLFKGRGGQAEELIQRLNKNKFLAVIGSSGTGKSSLVRAGLIPQLFGGYLHEAGNKWNIAICRPGNNPVDNLAIALASVNEKSRNEEKILESYKEIEPLLNNSIYGLLDVNQMINRTRVIEEKETIIEDKKNLLVIIDQFEELFRFSKISQIRNSTESHFVNLLLKASLNLNDNVYIIITMRSEFLGDCVKFQGLPEVINSGQYLVPQLDRGQLKEVIEGPIRLARKTISTGLVELLINRIEENKMKDSPDQLPILQHALMRTYKNACANGHMEISYDNYKAVGGMEEALAQHAKAKFMELGTKTGNVGELTKKQKIVKIIFQALTDLSTGQKGGRRPLELRKLYELGTLVNASKEEVEAVVETYRENDTSFIMPPQTTNLNPNLVIDISHETLMRNWGDLDTWIKQELYYGKLYIRLNERRELDDFIQGALLRDLTDMKSTYPINAVWASRYHKHTDEITDSSDETLFKMNMDFLIVCIKHSDDIILKEQQRSEDEIRRKEQEKSRRKITRILGIASLISVSLAIWAWKLRAEASKNYEIASNSLIKSNQQQIITDSLRIKAIAFGDILAKQKEDILQKKEQADSLRGLAEANSKEIINQKRTLEMQLVINRLQKEYFYRSTGLDPATRQKMFNSIFKVRLLKPEKVDSSKFIKTGLLASFNKTVKAIDTLQTAPTIGLRMAYRVWIEGRNNSIINASLSSIFKKNIFSSQIIDLEDDILKLFLSKNGANFLVVGFDSIYSGKFDKTTLQFNNKIPKEDAFSNWKASIMQDNNQILALEGGRIIKWLNGHETIVDSIPVPVSAAFSPDGNILVTADNDSLKLWDLNNLRDKKGYKFTSLTKSTVTKRIRSLIISPDSKKLIVLSSSPTEVWDLITKERLANQDPINPYDLMFANFSPDSKYLLITRRTTIDLLDLKGVKHVSFDLDLPTNKSASGYSTSEIRKVALSPDWKKIIFLYKNAAYVAAGATEESLFQYTVEDDSKKSKKKNIPLLLKKLNDGGKYVVDVSFLNAQSIITAEQSGKINLWSIDKNFDKNLDEGFLSIQRLIKPTLLERLATGHLSFDEVIISSNKNLLTEAARFYFRSIYLSNGSLNTDHLLKAKSIYVRLFEIDKSGSRYSRLEDMIGINNILNSYTDGSGLSVYKNKLIRAKENVVWSKELVEKSPADIYYTSLMSNSYGALSFYLLFFSDFKGAIASANIGLKLKPDNLFIYTNLALGYLLNGDFERAKDIYVNYKDRLDNNVKLKFSFLKDFKDLQEAKIISGNERDVIRIKKLLNDN